MSTLIGAVKSATNSIPVRVTTEKRSWLKVTENTPGRDRRCGTVAAVGDRRPDALDQDRAPGPRRSPRRNTARGILDDPGEGTLRRTLVANRIDDKPTTRRRKCDRHRGLPVVDGRGIGECEEACRLATAIVDDQALDRRRAHGRCATCRCGSPARHSPGARRVQSVRSAVSGSTRIARRVGTASAKTPAAIMVPIAASHAHGRTASRRRQAAER